ncbi:MAG: hypothetical protein N2645_05135 [Clostridia bacterium]|nr:hypothetical protein [Clostridia bacterium]
MENEALNLIKQEMDKNNQQLHYIYTELKKVSERLNEACELTGAAQRARDIRKEILEMGWQEVFNTYHPDINHLDPAAKELFAFYRFVYHDMKKKGEIS